MNVRYLLAGMILLTGISACDSTDPAQSGTQQTATTAAPETTAPAAPLASDDPARGNWQNYNRELNGMRYSPLDQINRSNVTQLQQAWSHAAGGQATPIVVDGIMYVPTANGVSAIAADTGATVWDHNLGEEVRISQRGVAYWPGDPDHAPRILFMSGPKMHALEAATGEPVAGFGAAGVIEVGTPYLGVPTIYQHAVVIGANTGELSFGVSGNTRAFDARTGEKLWEFNNVPKPGEVGHETWLDEGWDGRSGTNVWAFSMTVDEERGILYMPVAGPSGNYWGGDRPGNNLFANSVVAVDALTGKYLWHFQLVHHALWDEDMPSPPVLFDLEKDGQTIPALAIVNKTSYMFFLNRVTGEPIYAVEERPVPQGEVPEEWHSPTQPFPVTPPPLSRVSFQKEDMVTAEDTTPEHVAACQKLWDDSGGFYNAGPYTPFGYHEEGSPPKSTIQFPGGVGGVNWGGSAYDPSLDYVIVNAIESSLVGWIEKKKPGLNYGRGTEGAQQAYDRASISGPGPYAGFNAQVKDKDGNVIGMWPCQRPPWARLVAVNAKTGEIAWATVLGINEALPEGKQKVGGSGSAGPTVTAGGLVFIGATSDHRFRAFDVADGKELWVTDLGQVASANPMTYLGKNGKQYVAIIARNEVKVFALP